MNETKEQQPRSKTPREKISNETKRDCKKRYEHLLDDVYDELLNQPTHLDALVHGFKRASALYTKLGIDSARTQWLILFLTLGVLILGIDFLPGWLRSVLAIALILLSFGLRIRWSRESRPERGEVNK